ncbi:acyltransferase [Bdellovibrio sp. NC01]|uniref:acyltransferase family protein n=1 Tax=Bdellovibrio sp. NC01 TaxID=2220073 RepID=UPI00115849EF|nr:acyltransferase [Bdellovibrio sp. NC01]QDK37503.1 acyltransferase [Bdellovibrio sp. NC01]
MTNRRLPELDILRVLAASFVMLYHFTFREPVMNQIPTVTFPIIGTLTRYGFLGVQLFFIISGFVILMSAEKGTATDFIKNRAQRIYPTFWICCTITFFACLLWGAPVFTPTWYQYFVNMTLMTDFIREYAIDGAYWSIFVEIKFYLLIYLILLCKKILKIELIYFFWIGAIGLFSILPGDHKMTQEFLLAHYAPYFAIGSIFYLWWQKRASVISYLTFAIAYAVAVYNTNYEVFVLNRDYHQEYFSIWVYNIIIASFVVSMFLILTDKIKIKGSKTITQLGLLTYPLYLIHQNIGVLLMKSLPIEMSGTLIVALACILAIAIAWVVLVSEKHIMQRIFSYKKQTSATIA